MPSKSGLRARLVTGVRERPDRILMTKEHTRRMLKIRCA